ncbi:hypothetical protein A0R60_3721 [Enterobacter asburiae]|nr:hypothetical protein A0R60_3721 [Enterobacter asburiae]
MKKISVHPSLAQLEFKQGETAAKFRMSWIVMADLSEKIGQFNSFSALFELRGETARIFQQTVSSP